LPFWSLYRSSMPRGSLAPRPESVDTLIRTFHEQGEPAQASASSETTGETAPAAAAPRSLYIRILDVVEQVNVLSLIQFFDFLRKPKLFWMLLFVFLFRLGEGFLLVEAPLFMQGKVTDGGLGMCATDAISAACPHLLEDKALIDGFISTAVSLAFGMLGGWFAGKF